MKTLCPLIATALILFAGSAQAACYADYKAKRDNPLKLHYGVIKVSDKSCGSDNVAKIIAPRLKQDGWTLLNVLGTFGEEGLDRRRGNAGQYFLRY